MFENTRYFIVDMDGTFYLDGTIIPGADRFLRRAKDCGKDFFFFTNNSSNNVQSCCARLAQMGFPVEEQTVIISSHVAIAYIQEHHPGAAVYLLGNEKLTADIEAAGIRLVQEKPEVVLLGFDTTLTYEKIRKAAQFITDGAVYLATHPDKTCPAVGGFIPDTGAMMEMFSAATGRYPTVLGKPTVHTVDYLTARLGCSRTDLAFVGDRLETDIAIAAKHGIPCALVLTGVTTAESYEQSDIRADVVVPSLADLAEYL